MSTLSYRATNGDGGNTTFSIDTFSEDEIKVYVNEVLKTKGSSNDYQISNYSATGGRIDWVGSAPTSNDRIRIVRQTKILNNGGNAVEGKATYSAGAAVKATDLNNNTKQVLRSLQEHNDQLIQTYDIEPDGITNALIADDQIDSEHYVDGSIDHQHLSNDCIDGDNIQDDVINSEHYAPLSIDEEHIANSAVTSNKIADNAITTTEILNGAVTRAKLEADIIDGTKLADNAVDSEHYTDGSIDRVHLEADIIDSTKLADDSVNSEHYVDESIDRIHLAADIVDGTKIADDSVDSEHIAAGSLDNEHYGAGSITADKLNNTTVITSSEQGSATTNDTSFLTSAAADARFFNISSGDTIKDGQPFPDNDTTIATTAAINDRIIDLVDDVGGFVPIANETSFPTANPDVNNGPGTLISIREIASTRTPNTGTVTIANGAGSNTVIISDCGSTVLSAGFGVIVETTSVTHTYQFHRLVPKATEVTTVATNATQVQTVANNISNINAVAADASDIGIVAADGTDIGLVAGSISNVNTTAGSIGNVNTVAGNISNVNSVGSNISNVNSVASNESNINSAVSNASNINSAVSNASNINTVAGSITNVNNVGGSITNVNSVASNLASVNSFANTYRIGSTNPDTSLDVGDLFFNTTTDSLKVYTGSAWVDGVTATGNFALKTGNTFTGSNIYNDNVKALFGTGSDLEIFHDNNGDSNIINNTGHLTIRNNTAGKIINLQPKAAENGIITRYDGASELYYDNVKRIETASAGANIVGDLDVINGHVYINDNYKVNVGTGNDLQISHTGSFTKIDNNTGDLNIFAASGGTIGLFDDGGTETLAKLTPNGAVELYYDNTKKFETTSYGVLSTEALKLNGNFLELNNSGDVQYTLNKGGTQLFSIRNNSTAGVHINTQNSAILALGVSTGSNNGTVESDLRILAGGLIQIPHDNKKLQIGAGQDLELYHDGTDTYIDNHQGDLFIRGDGDDIFLKAVDTKDSLRCLPNDAVYLFFNDSKKLETTNTGATVTGTITAGGAILSGNQSIASDSAKLFLGASNDLEIYHDGSNSYIKDAGTGALRILGNAIQLKNTANDELGLEFTEDGSLDLYHNGSKKFETTSTGVTVTGHVTPSGNLVLGDSSGGSNNRVVCGAGADLNLYSDGTNVRYEGNNLQFKNANGDEFLAKMTNGGAVQLYFDDSKKFDTTSYGAYITGALHINTDQAAISGIKQIIYEGATVYQNSTTGTGGNNGFYLGNSTGAVAYVWNYENSDIQFGTNNNTRWRILSGGDLIPHADSTYDIGTNGTRVANIYADTLYGDGSNLTGISSVGGATGVDFNDNVKARFGTGNDLEIYHDGTRNYIDSKSTQLRIEADALRLRSDAGETYLEAAANGSVQLYYDNSEKLATTSTGVSVTGHIAGETLSMTGTNNARALEINPGSNGGSIVLDRNGHITSLIRASDGGSNVSGSSGGGSRITLGKTQMHFKTYPYVTNLGDQPTYTTRASIDTSGNFVPGANNSYSLGTSSLRWSNIFTADLNMSNKGSSNDVDGTWGDYTLQEGESDLFLINNRSGKKYKFNLTEVS